jgi:flagellar biosynthesis/type III secretory pathway chaperone
MTPQPQHQAGAGPQLDALVRCLEDEYRALLADDHAGLEAVLAHKEQLLARLATLPELAVGAPQGDRGRAQAPWKKTLLRVRDLNRRNAIALAPRAIGNGARLRFLQAALGRANLYGADGAMAVAGRFGAALPPRAA